MSLSWYYALGLAGLLACAVCAPVRAENVGAENVRTERWTFDPQLLLASSKSVIQRAPDASLDQLFQAVAVAARQPQELQAMCVIFDPRAQRDLAALNRIALNLSQTSQQNFQRATEILLRDSRAAAAQPYDAAQAQRALRQAAVAAAMLFDGFLAAINHPASDPASQRARCRALRQLLDVISMRPLAERALITRLLLREGLRRIERKP